MRIAIGCDHTVVGFKNNLVKVLTAQNHQVFDCGTYDNVRTHYPIYGRAVGLEIASGRVDRGIVICGTGVGISLSANRIQGVRCALVSDVLMTQKARSKFNANVISFGGLIVGEGLGLAIVEAFLKTDYLGDNKKIIDHLNTLSAPINQSSHFFHHEIKEWVKGKYTDGVKQEKIELPHKNKIG